MLRLVFSLILFMVIFSCQKEDVILEGTNLETVIESRTGCLENCNYSLLLCNNGGGQIGETRADLYEYIQCRCSSVDDPTPNQGCIWYGNNLNNPSGLSCPELYDRYIDWTDNCYITYSLCANACADAIDPSFGCLGDMDCDGIPNYKDPDIDGDGIGNKRDRDDDGDGILDVYDRCPKDPRNLC